MNELTNNIKKIHTTKLGKTRIKKNLYLDKNINIKKYCIDKITSDKCVIVQNGKNYYCSIDNIVITVNALSYTIITAHYV